MKALFHNVCDVKEENGKYRPVRFTDRQFQALEAVDPMFFRIGSCAASICLRFYTDAEEISFSYQYTVCYTRIGGFDVYENGVMCRNEKLPEESCEGVFRYRKETAGETLIEIYLPSNAKMELWDLNLGNYRPAEPDGDKLVLFLGDSITQSAYIPTSSLCFPVTVAKEKKMRVINRGVGSLCFEPTTLDENDGLCPEVVFCEFGANDLVKHKDGKVVTENGEVQWCDESDFPELLGKAEAYLKKLTEIYPNAKKCMISILWQASAAPAERLAVRAAYCRELQKLAAKYKMKFIEGTTLIPHIAESCTADQVHLSMLGNAAVARNLVKYIED